MLITSAKLDEKIRSDPAGAYLFFGEEEYLKAHSLGVIRKTLVPDPGLAVFNHIKIDGGNVDALRDEINALPMFGLSGGTKLIELRDLDFNKMSKSELENLCELLTDVGDNAVVIYTLPSEFPAGTAKRPSAQLTALSKVADAVNFERQTPARLASWLARHFASHGCSADPDTCRFMVEYCTPDMFILSSEVEKLCAYAKSHGSDVVDIDTVRRVSSPSKEFGSFDLSNYLLEGNFAGVFAVVEDMKRQKEKPEIIMAQLSRLWGELLTVRALADSGMTKSGIASALKMSEYPVSLRMKAASAYPAGKLESIVKKCAAADRDIKSSPINKYYVIEELLLTVSV